MSVKLVKNEIVRFLGSPESEVICISGKWGVGKTYAWRQYLEETQKNNLISKNYEKYAYISLFGQNSLRDVKSSIFPSTISIDKLKEGPNVETFLEKIHAKNWRTAVKLLSNALESKIPITLDQLFLLSLRKQIICIDDIERRGDGLQIGDILGLVSYLKEEKKCKIVIILNEEMLEDTDLREFKKQLEKVVDVFLKFVPTPEETCDIGINKDSSFCVIFTEHCIKLGIVNVRVIRKIQRLAYILQNKLSKFDDRVFEGVLRSLILLGWAFYQPSEAPSIEFIRENSRYYSSLLKEHDEKTTEEEKRWGALLSSYGWIRFDEFDFLILEGIKNGYFDDVKLDYEATKMEKMIKKGDSDASFDESWQLYYGSFDYNEEDVLRGMYDAFMNNVEFITPINLNSTVKFFKEFGKTAEAAKMLEYYMDTHLGDRDFYNLKNYPFRGEISDIDVVEAFNKKFEDFIDLRDPSEVLEGLVKNRGWGPEDINLLAKLTVDKFYELFKKTKGNSLRTIIRGALNFSSIGNIGVKEKQISINATEALKRIASESEINRRRVEVYGIKLDSLEQNPEKSTQKN